MRKNKIIYWTSTIIILLVMLFSIYKIFTPDYDRFGLPHYLRVELTIFKIIGLFVLLIPQVPMRIKEWAYAGFAITLISAAVAHYNSGDTLARAMDPIIFLVILGVSNSYLHKLNPSKS